jgi:hypothetical protein
VGGDGRAALPLGGPTNRTVPLCCEETCGFTPILVVVVGVLAPGASAAGRIRDAFHDYDHQGPPSVSERLTREHAGGEAASKASTHPQLGDTELGGPRTRR